MRGMSGTSNLFKIKMEWIFVMRRPFFATLLLITLNSTAFPSYGFASWTSWEKIKNLQKIGKSLAKAGRVPVAIQCKRAPDRVYFRNALFRLKTVPKRHVRIHQWNVSIRQWSICDWPKQNLGNLVIKSCSRLPLTPSGVRLLVH